MLYSEDDNHVVLAGLVHNDQVQCKGFDSLRGFLESRHELWSLNQAFLPGLNFRLCLSKVFDRGVEGDQKPFHFLNFCGFINQKKYFKIDIERQKFFKKF